MKWSKIQQHTRKRNLRIIREKENGEYSQIFDHKTRLKEKDKILISKSHLKEVTLDKAQSLFLPFYFKGDYFYEENINYAEKLIIEETEDYIILNKDHGLVSQPGNNSKMNLVFLMNIYIYKSNQELLSSEDCDLLDTKDRKCYPVQRLDKGTSGVMVIATNPKAASEISFLIKRREILKEYIAFSYGFPDHGVLTDFEFEGEITTSYAFNGKDKM